MKKVFYPLVMILLILACQSEKKPEFLLLDKIADLHCQAKNLKDLRFSLADSMRYYQDSLRLHPDQKEKQLKWQEIIEQQLIRKDDLANASRDLADSIRQYLNISTANMSPADKRVFNEALKEKSQQNCP
ncbi:hypothetical protein [Membranihabitans marinus]|uniref:hypothetical protein n=1 Tax=Membranihabitans marinus TaxID=1227546 RepID=UPI001F3E42A6|nr:hypothetical protein [Membranihabitans marinus]